MIAPGLVLALLCQAPDGGAVTTDARPDAGARDADAAADAAGDGVRLAAPSPSLARVLRGHLVGRIFARGSRRPVVGDITASEATG